MDNGVQPMQLAIKQLPNIALDTNPDDKLPAISQALLKKQKETAQQASQSQGYSPAAISQALATVNPNSKDASVKVGKAIATPNYAGYCLQWVDDQQGNSNRLPTAYADYQSKAASGNIQESDSAPKGARVYFAPDESNGNMGHVGISNGDGSFTSATDDGIKTFSLKDWQNLTGQQFLGWSK